MLGFFICRLLVKRFLDNKVKTQFTMLSITLYFIWHIFVTIHSLIMKKLHLLLITLTLTHVSYASFPVTNDIEITTVDCSKRFCGY